MNINFHILLVVAFLIAGIARADDTDQNFGSIKKIDLSDERPASPGHMQIMLDLRKVKPGSLGQVILYQFSKRVRVDFEADGLPKGEYVIAAASKCSPTYGKAWTDLHRFHSTSAHIQNEKSLPKVSLNDAQAGHFLLKGKFIALFRVKPALLIDCKPIVAGQETP